MNERKVEPNGLFRIWSPDAVAECIDGVSDALYRRLWELVPEKRPEGETPDVLFAHALINFWHRLSADEQVELNRLAQAHEARYA